MTTTWPNVAANYVKLQCRHTCTSHGYHQGRRKEFMSRGSKNSGGSGCPPPPRHDSHKSHRSTLGVRTPGFRTPGFLRPPPPLVLINGASDMGVSASSSLTVGVSTATKQTLVCVRLCHCYRYDIRLNMPVCRYWRIELSFLRPIMVAV